MSLAPPLRAGLAPCFRLRTGLVLPRQSLRSLSTTTSTSQRLVPNPIDARALALSRSAHSHQGGGRSQPGSRGFNWSLLAGAAFASTASTALISRNSIHCEPSTFTSSSSPLDRSSYTSSTPEPSPESIVNVYQLSFGAICGVCAGVFIKKGLKFIAFLLGGGFILLQYLSSQRLVNVNWTGLSRKYDGIVGSAAGPGSDVKGWQGSTAARIWNRFESFLTANFQERASLLAGLALGLRLG